MLLTHWCKYLTICKLRKSKYTINFAWVLRDCDGIWKN